MQQQQQQGKKSALRLSPAQTNQLKAALKARSPEQQAAGVANLLRVMEDKGLTETQRMCLDELLIGISDRAAAATAGIEPEPELNLASASSASASSASAGSAGFMGPLIKAAPYAAQPVAPDAPVKRYKKPRRDLRGVPPFPSLDCTDSSDLGPLAPLQPFSAPLGPATGSGSVGSSCGGGALLGALNNFSALASLGLDADNTDIDQLQREANILQQASKAVQAQLQLVKSAQEYKRAREHQASGAPPPQKRKNRGR